MTKSQQVLLALLKKSLFNIDISLPSEVNWQEVYDEAVSQSVVPIAYDGTAGVTDMPREVAKKFKDYSLAVFLQNDSVLQGQRDVAELLQQNGIAYAILKGASVARYYSKPELRTLGDVDLLVSKADFEDTKKLLVSNGYTLTREEKNHFHCNFKKQDVIFELHFEMSDFPPTKLGSDLKTQLANATKCTKEAKCFSQEFCSLDTLYQAVSLLLHTERHLIADGIGIRQLLDFGMFCYANPEFLDDECHTAFLKKYGLYKLAEISKELFEKYFLDKQIESPSADLLFEVALKKGNFGTKREREETYSNFDLEKQHKSALVNYFLYFKKRAKYTWPLAKKVPWLRNLGFIYLPIRHVFRVIFRKTEKVDYAKILNSNNEINKLYNELSVFKEYESGK